MCIRLGIGIVVSSLAVLVGARTPAAERDTVVYHDMAVIPKTVYGPFPEERAVLTDTSSLVIATLPPKYKQTVHYHDQEQFTLGFGGAVGYSIGGVHHDLGAHGVGLPPSNVTHGMDNDSDVTASMIEYQPVLRREWLPPHPKVPPQPQSMEPILLRAGQRVTMDFDRSSSGWRVLRNGARLKVLEGAMIRATFLDLAKNGASVNISDHPSLRERLAFVLDGHVTSTIGRAKRDIGPEMLVEIRPAAKDVSLESRGTGPALIVVFETSLPK